MNIRHCVFSVGVLLFAACSTSSNRGDLLDAAAFDTEIDGVPVALYTLSNGRGLDVQVTNFGARVVSIFVPDRNGACADVVVGCESIARYLDDPEARFSGPVVGRFANRIGGGRFTLDGTEYRLLQNDNGNSLHGGVKGLDSRVWSVAEADDRHVAMRYVSPDGEEGYPGELTVCVTYTVTDDNALKIEYAATTDRPTVVNLSNHSLFNLGGEGSGSVLDHELWIAADATTPVDSVLIPTGALAPVEGTPFDFRTPTPIGARIDADDEQLRYGHGYDHNWALCDTTGEVRLVASLYDPGSGRMMEILTDQPGLQFYSGNFFGDSSCGKFGRKIGYRGAVALETQNFPDAPNKPAFPSSVLRPGETYTQICIYRFGVVSEI
ncbi:MAG: galactose mutarotase [Alistipes sp.]|nr:galactose mutarotase [Alistipes senegalensis]MCM1250541.1 galactose mutarotase [Alistipes sp.]